MGTRHLVWFRVETGGWLGEWYGALPAPQVPPPLIGDARLMFLNACLQQAQRAISPFGSP